jgi:hypothetical protein
MIKSEQTIAWSDMIADRGTVGRSRARHLRQHDLSPSTWLSIVRIISVALRNSSGLGVRRPADAIGQVN